MSFPKLSMREIRHHPAVMTDPDDLQPELEVALCHLMPPVGRGVRCAQALISLIPDTDKDASRRERIKSGYHHTPTWGIVVNDVAVVNWVNTTNMVHEHPYASFSITHSARDLSPAERFSDLATSMSEVGVRINGLPPVCVENVDGDLVPFYDQIIGFDNLGLAPEPYGLNQFVVDLSKLG